MTLLDTVTIPEPVLKVWRETEWHTCEDGSIRSPDNMCPLLEACSSITGRVWSNGFVRDAAREVGIARSDANLIICLSDWPNEKFCQEFEQLLGLRK